MADNHITLKQTEGPDGYEYTINLEIGTNSSKSLIDVLDGAEDIVLKIGADEIPVESDDLSVIVEILKDMLEKMGVVQ